MIKYFLFFYRIQKGGKPGVKILRSPNFETLCVEWRNATPLFASTPARRNENIKYIISSSKNQTNNLFLCATTDLSKILINDNSFLRVEIEPTNFPLTVPLRLDNLNEIYIIFFMDKE